MIQIDILQENHWLKRGGEISLSTVCLLCKHVRHTRVAYSRIERETRGERYFSLSLCTSKEKRENMRRKRMKTSSLSWVGRENERAREKEKRETMRFFSPFLTRYDCCLCCCCCRRIKSIAYKNVATKNPLARKTRTRERRRSRGGTNAYIYKQL